MFSRHGLLAGNSGQPAMLAEPAVVDPPEDALLVVRAAADVDRVALGRGVGWAEVDRLVVGDDADAVGVDGSTVAVGSAAVAGTEPMAGPLGRRPGWLVHEAATSSRVPQVTSSSGRRICPS
jgi:hypothetical protein